VVPPPVATPVAPSGIQAPSDIPTLKGRQGRAPAKSKAAAPPTPQEPAKGPGKKAAVRLADQEAAHPMQTRGASRAGGLRGVGCSGKQDTCGANGTPSKTCVVIFSQEGFLPTPGFSRLKGPA
jgi:hypothetical protein